MGVKRDEIIGRIITLQSRRYDGSYADCHDSYKVRVTQCNYTDVPNAVWTRFLVHEGPSGTIVLESVRYRNHYMDAHDSGEIHLTHSPNPPTGEDWAKWRMVNVSGYDIVALKTVRYENSYLDAHDSGLCHVTYGKPSDIWAQWRLAIGPGQGIKDGYEVVASMKNDLDVPTTFKYKHTVGTSLTQGSSTTLTREISEEMNINFGKGPLSIGSTTTVKFSTQWSKSSSTTWSETTEVAADVEVPAKKKVLVSQLQGTYGPLTAHSNHLMTSYE